MAATALETIRTAVAELEVDGGKLAFASSANLVIVMDMLDKDMKHPHR